MADAGRFELQGRVMLPGGAEHDCWLRFENYDEVELALPVTVPSGSHLVCHVFGLGVVVGTAHDFNGSSCRLVVRASPAHRARLVGRMAWHRRRAIGDEDRRTSERVVPTSAAVRLGWLDGRVSEGTVIDLSSTGAAIRSRDRPEPNVSVVVGRRRAVVIRHLMDGFAVRFVLPLPPQDVTEDTVL